MPMTTDAKISLIVPLRLTGSTHEGELRLERLLRTVPDDLYEIVISDYGTDPQHRAPLDRLLHDGIRVVRHPAPHRLFSIGHSRDFGVQQATCDVIMFNDIDFLATPDMYRRIHAEVQRRALASHPWDFFCVPVLFLTEDGTRLWFDKAFESGEDLIAPLTPARLEDARDLVQSTAYGSSAMVINRRHYLTVGGHDPRFSGHGGEDYDILHRLAALSPRGPRPHDYYVDYRDNNVGRYRGFRPFFALYGLDLLGEGLHLVHLWHPRRQEKGYFRAAQNFRHLRKLMRRFDRKGDQPMPLASPHREKKLMLIVATHEDRVTFRAWLPLSRDYRVFRLRAGASPEKAIAAAEAFGPDLILVGPDAAKNHALLKALKQKGLPSVRAERQAASERLSLLACGTWSKSPPTKAQGEPGFSTAWAGPAIPVRTVAGQLVAIRWPDIAIPGLGQIREPAPRPPEPPSSPLFETFGNDLAPGRRQPRPRRRRKSSLWVRIKRRLSGY